MRHGTAPDGGVYYPAFPYTAYTRLSDADIADLWAWLQTVEPVARAPQPHELPPGLDSQLGVRIWRQLYFEPGPLPPARDRSDAWRRGRYLALALGHCDTCHTPRDALGGPRSEHWLAGGDEPEPGPNITPHTDGIAEWTADDVETLLDMGMLPDGDFAGSTMRPVVRDGTEHLTQEDRAAIATWLRTVPARPDVPEGDEGLPHPLPALAALLAGGIAQLLAAVGAARFRPGSERGERALWASTVLSAGGLLAYAALFLARAWDPPGSAVLDGLLAAGPPLLAISAAAQIVSVGAAARARPLAATASVIAWLGLLAALWGLRGLGLW